MKVELYITTIDDKVKNRALGLQKSLAETEKSIKATLKTQRTYIFSSTSKLIKKVIKKDMGVSDHM